MRRLLLGLLAGLVVLSGLASALPLAASPVTWSGATFYGIATQGSLDSRDDWPLYGSPVCPQVMSRVQARLVVMVAGKDDVLYLRLAGVDTPAVARMGAPAILATLQGDPCIEFQVEGHAVGLAALYRVETQSSYP